MDPAYYVAAGSLKARAFQLDVVSNNLANSATVGYKSDRAFFQVFNKAKAEGRGLPMTPYVNDGVVIAETGVEMAQGTLKPTGRQLDFALDGDGFFTVQTPQGKLLTRDGRFQLGKGGRLEAADGSPVLGKNGQPITVDPAAGELSLGVDGTLQQKGQAIGQLDVKAYEKPGELRRAGNLRFTPSGKEVPAKARVVQGHLEQSGVDLAGSMVEMIRLNRLFELSQKVASTLSNDLDAKSIADIARS